jgi:hypothetical protein
LDYTKPVSAGAQAKISVGSFLPFSTASTHSGPQTPTPTPDQPARNTGRDNIKAQLIEINYRARVLRLVLPSDQAGASLGDRAQTA